TRQGVRMLPKCCPDNSVMLSGCCRYAVRMLPEWVSGCGRNMHYFDDFINAMYKHTKDYDNDLEEEMQRRFQNTICNAKKGLGSINCC
ncbi:hypothetical protein L7E55_16730, partial [Pelotomaculum isophthalicicum JI]